MLKMQELFFSFSCVSKKIKKPKKKRTDPAGERVLFTSAARLTGAAACFFGNPAYCPASFAFGELRRDLVPWLCVPPFRMVCLYRLCNKLLSSHSKFNPKLVKVKGFLLQFSPRKTLKIQHDFNEANIPPFGLLKFNEQFHYKISLEIFRFKNNIL